MNRSNDKTLFILMIFAWFVLVPNGAYAQEAPKVSDLINNTYVQVKSMPSLIALLAYLSGLLLAFNGILEFKSHVEDPKSVKLREPYVKLLAGGALFSLPYMSEVMVGNLFGDADATLLTTTSRNNSAVTGEVDEMIYNFITDIHGPMLTLITGFAYVCAIIFLVIGINKLVKMSRDGFKGVPPMSVIGNFIVAGALFAFGGMAGTFSTSIFGDATVNTYAVISTEIIEKEDGKRIATVIDALMAFVAMVGFIAFLRGWFVLRDVTEGGKGTIAQAITFLIGGTLAINLGEVINILQATMGIDSNLGLSFN